MVDVLERHTRAAKLFGRRQVKVSPMFSSQALYTLYRSPYSPWPFRSHYSVTRKWNLIGCRICWFPTISQSKAIIRMLGTHGDSDTRTEVVAWAWHCGLSHRCPVGQSVWLAKLHCKFVHYDYFHTNLTRAKSKCISIRIHTHGEYFPSYIVCIKLILTYSDLIANIHCTGDMMFKWQMHVRTRKSLTRTSPLLSPVLIYLSTEFKK
jgi:hypothetical protein